MGIIIETSTTISGSGTVSHHVIIYGDGFRLVDESGSATAADKQPTLARVATIALEKLARHYHDAKKQLETCGLIEKPAPSEGPYR